MNNQTERKNLKVYFWIDQTTLKYIDSECQKKMISRSAYLRWLIVNFNEGTIHQINEIYNELILKGTIREFAKGVIK